MHDLKQLISEIKQQKPLILNLSNYVTMDFVANGLLSLGASPVMSMGEKELADLIQLASAVVINIGTLNDDFIALCHNACLLANQLHKPLIFDPVGVGASAYRTCSAQALVERHTFAIIRGNASEIAALAGLSSVTKGGDSSLAGGTILALAKDYARAHHTVLSVSGAIDYIISEDNYTANHSGSAFMPMITGTGCLLSAVTAAFHAMHADAYTAAWAASNFYGQCGERAALKARGPGSFKEAFLDQLYLFGTNPNE